MKKPTYNKKIEFNLPDSQLIVILENWILEMSNAGLISLGIHFACKRFIKELKDTYLSEELQESLTIKK